MVAVQSPGDADVVFCRDDAAVTFLQPEDSRFRGQVAIPALRAQRHGYVFGDCFSSVARGSDVEWLLDLDAVDDVLRDSGFYEEGPSTSGASAAA